MNKFIQIQKRFIYYGARFRIADNSELGMMKKETDRWPKLIGRWTGKKKFELGDIIVVAFLGKVQRGMIVGLKNTHKQRQPDVWDNYMIFLDSKAEPMGTKVTVPLPLDFRRRFHPKHKIFTMCDTWV